MLTKFAYSYYLEFTFDKVCSTFVGFLPPEPLGLRIWTLSDDNEREIGISIRSAASLNIFINYLKFFWEIWLKSSLY